MTGKTNHESVDVSPIKNLTGDFPGSKMLVLYQGLPGGVALLTPTLRLMFPG